MENIRAFEHLRKIENVPDVPAAVANGASAHGLLSLSNSKEGKRFRVWLARHLAEGSAEEISQRYVAALKTRQPWPLKIVRFLVTTAVSVKCPAAGVVLDGADAGFGDSIGVGYSPRVFFDDLRTAIPQRMRGILNLS